MTPNIALSESRLDANIFQHKPYLEQFTKEKGLALKVLAQVPTAPLGLYPAKLKNLSDIKIESSVAIPNDPTNLSRALTILSDLNWIKLKEGVDPFLIGLQDIKDNPKKLKITLLEAAQIPRVIKDVDYAVINGNYATSAGLKLTSALVQEKSNQYINWVVVEEKNMSSQKSKDLIEVLNSEAFKNFARQKFEGYKWPDSWAQ